MLCPYTSFHYSQFFARFVQKAVIHDVHRVDRLGHFGAFAREIDQNLNGFRFDVRVLSEDAPHLPRHFRGHFAIVHFPLLHQNIGHGFGVAFIPYKLQAAQRCADHPIDFVWILANMFLGGAKTVLRKLDHIADETTIRCSPSHGQ